ncbi:hypothetical protein G3578_16730 [Brevibacillus sp. SYP-B805]|uniref:NIPSNAP family protein n=1 Tax=Brevibacillus sp. SYP-B805 TaxID=1578199 RepID=UPI0013E9EA4A|nr:NIPSNAP family protein [Brevibacillus sp. SYP-B805]NGQ96812.1 hypothetical protein [Brevibacillus sp. SYP-B805]
MIYRRKTYRILPEKYEEFNRFFHQYLLPNQRKHGAKLVGRWVTENRDEIVAIWEYQDMRHYEEIEEKIRRDDLHSQAQQRRQELGELVIESRQDFMTATGTYHGARRGKP